MLRSITEEIGLEDYSMHTNTGGKTGIKLTHTSDNIGARIKINMNAYQRAWRIRKKMLLEQQQQELMSGMTLEDGELKKT